VDSPIGESRRWLLDDASGLGDLGVMPMQRWSERIWIAQLGQDPSFTDDVDALVHRALAATPVPHVVIDLSGVEHINSNNLAQLLKLRRVMIDGEARLRLAAPPNHVWAVFLSTGLDKVFEFTPDTSTALADLQMR
jgi:anti-anti-sigma factor